MLRRGTALCLVTLVLALPAAAAQVTPAQARQALARAVAFLRSISTQGGYCGIYAADLRSRYGEALYHPARPADIWVQPPGTPSVGQVFLRAYLATRDREYLLAAREVGRALWWGQRASGGWDYLVEVTGLAPDSTTPPRPAGSCTFDDDTTQAGLRFLMALDAHVHERWLDDAVARGLRHMLKSQYPNGAWPQCYPLRGGYHDLYTFNDAAINRCIDTMLEAHRRYGRPEYLASARRGGDFIIAAQGPPTQAGWAQQYGRDMRPAWARAFEPPAWCSSDTARNIRTLIDLYLYTGDRQYLAPIPAAIAWLERSKLAPRLWARFYEPGTNRPIYGDRDGKVPYTLEEISEERRRGYSWQGDYATAAIAYYREVLAVGRESYLQRQAPRSLTGAEREREEARLAAEVAPLLRSQDAQGRWLREDRLYIRDFVENLNRLCAYLEVAEPEQGAQ